MLTWNGRDLIDREKAKACTKKWRAENPEKYKESRKKWRAENPEKHKEHSRLWRVKNPEKMKTFCQVVQEKSSREKLFFRLLSTVGERSLRGGV